MDKIKSFIKGMNQSIKITVILMVLCGFIYPVIMTGVSHIIFPHQASGSLIEVNDQVIGSEHVGQEFSQPYFMKGRPSAVHYNTYIEKSNEEKVYLDGTEFNGLASGSNNYGPSNPELQKRVKKDIDAFLKSNPEIKREDIPTDLMTASGSGLDPDISIQSAKVQIPAIVKASGLTSEKLEDIIEQNTKHKFLGIFGEDTVNVLGVNLDIAEEMGLFQ